MILNRVKYDNTADTPSKDNRKYVYTWGKLMRMHAHSLAVCGQWGYLAKSNSTQYKIASVQSQDAWQIRAKGLDSYESLVYTENFNSVSVQFEFAWEGRVSESPWCLD